MGRTAYSKLQIFVKVFDEKIKPNKVLEDTLIIHLMNILKIKFRAAKEYTELLTFHKFFRKEGKYLIRNKGVY